jgi:hypothetical protein
MSKQVPNCKLLISNITYLVQSKINFKSPFFPPLILPNNE